MLNVPSVNWTSGVWFLWLNKINLRIPFLQDVVSTFVTASIIKYLQSTTQKSSSKAIGSAYHHTRMLFSY